MWTTLLALVPDWAKKALVGVAAVVALVFLFTTWLTIHDARVRADAVRGKVDEYRATAAEAERDELIRQVNAGKIVIDAYQVQLRNVRAKEEATANEVERRIAENEALRKATGRACVIDGADAKFLLDTE